MYNTTAVEEDHSFENPLEPFSLKVQCEIVVSVCAVANRPGVSRRTALSNSESWVTRSKGTVLSSIHPFFRDKFRLPRYASSEESRR